MCIKRGREILNNVNPVINFFCVNMAITDGISRVIHQRTQTTKKSTIDKEFKQLHCISLDLEMSFCNNKL